MRELLGPMLSALREAWYPDPPEGQPRKVKVSPVGVALLGVVVLAGQLYLMRAEIAEVKGQTTNIWNALVAAGLARATPVNQQQVALAVPTPTPAPKAVPPFQLDFLGSAEASDVAGRGPLRSGVRGPADRAVPGAGGRVGKVTQ